MHPLRTSLALDRPSFGRNVALEAPAARSAPAGSVLDDLRLFATTFGAGFLFVTIFFA